MTWFKKALCLVLMVLLIFSCTAPYTNTYAIPNIKSPNLIPGKFANTSWKLKSGVKTIPAALNYSTKEMELPDLLGKNNNIRNISIINQNTGTIGSINPNMPGSISVGQQNSSAQTNAAIDTTDITLKDFKYPIGASYMIINKDVSTFKPAVGEIYLDNNLKTALKVIASPVFDAATGKKVIPVVKPSINEIFESYKIPAQKIQVNKANVGYVMPTAADEDGASYINIEQTKEVKKVSLASAGDLPISFEDDCMVVTMKNVTIYEYPEPKPEDEKDKKPGSEEYNENQNNTGSEEGYYEDKGTKDDSGNGDTDKSTLDNDLKGVDEKDELKVKVKIEEGTLKIYKPRAFAEVDIGLLEQEIKVGFESDMVNEITLSGELKFNKVIETCIFGYDIEIPYGRAFIGIFLIVDAKGQVEVKAKVVTEGKMQVGLKAEAIAFIPVYVGPFAEPIIENVKVGFSADGEVEAKIGLVPQVGIVICDKEIAVFQLWLALKANAEFHIQGEAGTDVDNLNVTGKISGEGHLKLDAYAEFIGYLLGHKYSFFYKEWNLYDNSWSFGNEVEGGASNLTPIYGNISLQADAYNNKIKGHVSYFDDSKKKSIGSGSIYFGSSYMGSDIKVRITNKNGTVDTNTISTDSNGNFELTTPITPLDKVSASVNTTITDASGTRRNLICSSPAINPGIPYDKITFVADAFNDVVTGTVTGKVKGTETAGSEKMYSGPLTIEKLDKSGKITRGIVSAVNGVFTKPLPLVGGDSVKITLPFEGAVFPKEPEYKEASLDSLKIHFNRDVEKKEINGSIQNVYKEAAIPYKGDVIFKAYALAGGPGNIFNQQKAKAYSYNKFIPDKKSPTKFKSVTIETTASSFKASYDCLIFSIEINHDGIKKIITYNPLDNLKNKAKEPVQADVTNPLQDKIDSIINPGDQWTGVWETEEMGTLVLQQEDNIVTGVLDGGFDNYTVMAATEGNRIYGTFSKNGSSISFEAMLGDDGKSIQSFSYKDRVSNKTISFAGSKRSLSSSSSIFTGKNRQLWSGIWYTPYGTMILEQEGNIINGSVGADENRISGLLNGNIFSGVYYVDDVKFNLEFTISDDFKSVNGRFRPEGGGEWTDWEGSKGR